MSRTKGIYLVLLINNLKFIMFIVNTVASRGSRLSFPFPSDLIKNLFIEYEDYAIILVTNMPNDEGV